jgi:hypothetical protein
MSVQACDSIEKSELGGLIRHALPCEKIDQVRNSSICRILNHAKSHAAHAAGQPYYEGAKRSPEMTAEEKLVKYEHHPNSAEEGDTANIQQNTSNKGFFRGRHVG